MSRTLKLYLLISSCVAVLCSPSHAEGQNIVTQSSGTVLILRGTDEIPAVPGTVLMAGDILKTSEEGTADISLNGLAGARVLGTSEVSVDDTAAASMRLTIRSGNAIMNLDKLPTTSTFRVETPTAVASVRGTQFWGRVGSPSGEPVTTFAVREGAVQIFTKASSQTFDLTQGEALDIPQSSLIAPIVRAALDDEMKAMAQADSIRISA